MTPFAWFSLFTSIICLITAVAVYYLDKKALVNKVFMLTLVWSSFWSFAEFLRYQATSIETASILGKILFLWPFYSAFLIHFALAYTESDLLKHKVTYLLMYVPAAIFSGIDLTTNWISAPPVLRQWGFDFSAPPVSESVVVLVNSVWASSLALSALIICGLYYFRSTDHTKKTQTKFITFGLAFPVVSSLFTTSIFPLMNIPFPSLNSITTCLFSGIIAYAIWRYKLFNLNPAVAAENILSAMPDPLVLANADGKIIRVNHEFVTASGYSEKEIIGKPLSELFKTEKNDRQILLELSKTGEIRNHETIFTIKSGEPRNVLVSLSVVRNKKGHDLGFACVIHDITNRKLMAAKLVAAERFASIGELAGMVGHDLRNPLSSISAATFYLKNHYGALMDDTGRDMLSAIEKSIDYSNKIVKDLLDYSREMKLEIETATPRSILDMALSMVKVPPHIKLEENLEDTPKMSVDVAKVSRVFVNLITNAFDAMPNGGTLTITAQSKPEEIQFQFKDTGQGIPKEAQKKLWTPLFTTKTKGMGLGLPICKRIVEAHGGKIMVESETGRGTVFHVTLPLKNEPN
ncbi:MAG: ATP-binding protein [Candidatus Bathyarchaeota archaeon]|nr:ATP-binding protein [Candidatus Bathyarchaeota archaeon]